MFYAIGLVKMKILKQIEINARKTIKFARKWREILLEKNIINCYTKNIEKEKVIMKSE